MGGGLDPVRHYDVNHLTMTRDVSVYLMVVYVILSFLGGNFSSSKTS